MAISNTMTKSSCFVIQELLLFLLKANAQLRCLVDCALCIVHCALCIVHCALGEGGKMGRRKGKKSKMKGTKSKM